MVVLSYGCLLLSCLASSCGYLAVVFVPSRGCLVLSSHILWLFSFASPCLVVPLLLLSWGAKRGSSPSLCCDSLFRCVRVRVRVGASAMVNARVRVGDMVYLFFFDTSLSVSPPNHAIVRLSFPGNLPILVIVFLSAFLSEL